MIVDAASQQIQNTCITFIQRWPNVFDVGPTLYKCYTHVCVYWAVGMAVSVYCVMPPIKAGNQY